MRMPAVSTSLAPAISYLPTSRPSSVCRNCCSVLCGLCAAIPDAAHRFPESALPDLERSRDNGEERAGLGTGRRQRSTAHHLPVRCSRRRPRHLLRRTLPANRIRRRPTASCRTWCSSEPSRTDRCTEPAAQLLTCTRHVVADTDTRRGMRVPGSISTGTTPSPSSPCSAPSCCARTGPATARFWTRIHCLAFGCRLAGRRWRHVGQSV